MIKISFSQEEVSAVAQAINEAKYLVVLTGAGISTESGIPDFRGPDGTWTRRDKGLPPKPMSKPLEEMEPNAGHHALVELQNRGVLKFLISQNVDNLHLKSGIRSELLAELHGNHLIMKCLKCDARYTKEGLGWKDVSHGIGYRYHPQWSNQPRCTQCGGRIISSVINFSDPMPLKEMQEAENHTLRCDLMIVIGTSLTVYPANNFPKLAKKMGAKLIIINAEPTPLDNVANLKLEVKIGQFLLAVIDELKKNLKENRKD